jgi:hypothetical protein
MNIFDLAKQGWNAAEAFIDGLIQSASHTPALAALVSTVEATIKQDASDAVSIADTGFATAATTLAAATDTALDAAYTQYLGPVAPVASLASHDLVDKVRDAAIAQANLWALKAKAALAAPTP